jgi:hypothetical protein
MAKLGVGVGEEFPVDEAAPKDPSQTNESEPHCGRGWGHHHGRWHFAGHVLFRLAIVGLLIAGVMSFFVRHDIHDGFHGFHPYPHHFFFPFLAIALLAVLVFRRGRHHRHWHHGHAHNGHEHDRPSGDKEGT